MFHVIPVVAQYLLALFILVAKENFPTLLGATLLASHENFVAP